MTNKQIQIDIDSDYDSESLYNSKNLLQLTNVNALWKNIEWKIIKDIVSVHIKLKTNQ